MSLPVVTGSVMPPNPKSPYAAGWTSEVEGNSVVTMFRARKEPQRLDRFLVPGQGFAFCDPAAPAGGIATE